MRVLSVVWSSPRGFKLRPDRTGFYHYSRGEDFNSICVNIGSYISQCNIDFLNYHITTFMTIVVYLLMKRFLNKRSVFLCLQVSVKGVTVFCKGGTAIASNCI